MNVPVYRRALMGTWIEIIGTSLRATMASRRALMGTWIEILPYRKI